MFLLSRCLDLYYCCIRTIFLFCLLFASPPLRESPRARRSAGKNFPKSGPVPASGSGPRHSFWLSKSRAKSRSRVLSDRIVAPGDALARLVRVACVGSRMYVYTYIHTYMYIFIYRYIFGYFFFLVLVQKKKITFRKNRDFVKWKKVRPRAHVRGPRVA